ncbi:MAG: hypothetical protein LBC02_11465 [Planctomycetaceae bacterium]|jgi:predicted acylesterase/phospholipase RssA|nr:hypothetical protein [Planctomycetaceae bacterium]
METTQNINKINEDVTDLSIAVTLSGGGHRASIFGLGVLAYLYESRKNQSVTSISSVSGGSITNAYLGKECNFRNVTPDNLQKITSQLWYRLTSSGIVYAASITKIYAVFLFSVILLLVSCFFMPFIADAFGTMINCVQTKNVHVIAVLVLFIPLIWLLSIRSKICRKAFAEILFSSPDNSELPLNSITRENVNHIICATELHEGEHIYFSGNFVYSYQCGLGASDGVTLAEAVQASAAFPPLLPPIWINTVPFHFMESPIPKKLVLTDGGVYDNMGEQWIIGLTERKKKVPEIENFTFDANIIILVNATAGIKYSPMSRFDQVPFFGEGTSFYRIVCALFDQTTTTRREMLFSKFKRDLIEGNGVTGIMVMLTQTPFTIIDWIMTTTEPELEKQRKRAITILEKLPENYRKEWDNIKEISLKTKTTFRIINKPTAENLIYHAFILTMINAHIILGFPIDYDLLDRIEFRKKIMDKYFK